MKSHRKSRSAENRNARKEMLARGGSRRSEFGTGPIVTDRRWRRANRVTKAELDLLVARADGTVLRPTVSLVMDPYTRAILGWQVS